VYPHAVTPRTYYSPPEQPIGRTAYQAWRVGLDPEQRQRPPVLGSSAQEFVSQGGHRRRARRLVREAPWALAYGL